MKSVLRFAPSPTGHLHIGNVRTALFNWLFAEKTGGEVILRLDDTDIARCKQEYVDGIYEDLEWLGIGYSKEEKQSARAARYDEVLQKLIKDSRVYVCYETPEELEYMRRKQRKKGLPPIYDRSALSLTDNQKKAYEKEGRKPHYRFMLNHEEIKWTDLVRGDCHYHGAHQSDPIIVREDGTLLYMLPSVIDDADFGITHIIRGEDHVTNSAVQIQMFETLGAKVPEFAHLPLITGMDGKLSKRTGSLSVCEMREDGVEPMAINGFLAHLGAGRPFKPCFDLKEMAKDFDISSFGRSQPKFDIKELEHINAQLVHDMPYSYAVKRLESFNSKMVSEDFWETVKPNLSNIKEVSDWYQICMNDISCKVDAQDAEFLKNTVKFLPSEPWNEETFSIWTKDVSNNLARKGKELFMPIRLALTGLEHGPELKHLLPLIGKDKTIERLSKQ
ncbi:MAG: glutamate--tRNA ligase [Alphaproteobacteria bacterium]